MKKITLIYSVTNAIGMLYIIFFFVRAADFAKMEDRNYYDVGDSLNFVIFARPVLVACLLLNIGWGVKALIDLFRHREFRASIALVAAMAAWVILYLGCKYTHKLPPNQALLPTSMSVTDRAYARSAPDTLAADL